MQLTGLLHGAPLLRHVDFPVTEVLGPAATEAEIQNLIDRHKLIFIKPVFKGGVGKKGKAGLIGNASDLQTALAEKERLLFRRASPRQCHRQSQRRHLRGRRPGEARSLFLDHGFDRLPRPHHDAHPCGRRRYRGARQERSSPTCPFEALTGLKAFVVANALTDIGAPKEIISPLVQHLPKLWELVHHYGMTTLELNPIRMRLGREGRLTPVACDFKCGFDRDDPRWQRLDLPDHLFTADTSDFEHEVNQLRTHQGQSDVFVINEQGHHPRADLRRRRQLAGHRGARRGRDHLVGFRRQPALRENEGGRAHLLQALAHADQRVLHHRRKVEQHRHLSRPSAPWATRCASTSASHGPTPLFVVVGRGGPNLVRGMGALAETCDNLGLPYRFFGFDSAISEVVNYAKKVDDWMKAGGRAESPLISA